MSWFVVMEHFTKLMRKGYLATFHIISYNIKKHKLTKPQFVLVSQSILTSTDLFVVLRSIYNIENGLAVRSILLCLTCVFFLILWNFIKFFSSSVMGQQSTLAFNVFFVYSSCLIYTKSFIYNKFKKLFYFFDESRQI